MTVDRYVETFLSETKFVTSLCSSMPDLLEEIRGIAEGAAISFDIVAAYNFMDEQWWYDLRDGAGSEPGCSVIAIVGATNAAYPTILAQNMDLPSFMDGSQLVLRIRAPGQPEQLVLTSAGLIGLTGVNWAGVGVCVNTLVMLKHSIDGLPVSACLRGALSYDTRDSAVLFLESIVHASGQHYAVGTADGIIGLECCAAGTAVSSSATEEIMLHTNHPLANEHIDALSWEELNRHGRIQNSKSRLDFLKKHIGPVQSSAGVKALLADRSVPICVTPTPSRSTQTFGSILFELTQPPCASVCLGLPNSGQWHELAWSVDQTE
jgi:hypothetical protein